MVKLAQNYVLNKKYMLNREQCLTTSFYGIIAEFDEFESLSCMVHLIGALVAECADIIIILSWQ